jgi:outer membrane biosynthesis protein TonB
MGAESNPPPPSGGGLKYAVLGLVLLGGAAAVYLATRDDGPTEPVAEAPPPEVERPKRSTALSQDDFVIPEDDLEDEEEAEEEPQAPKRRAVRRKPVECDGEVNKTQVRKVFMQNERQVRACYERRLKVNNILQGRLDVEVRLGQTGSVDAVRIGGTLRDNEVHACVRRAAQSWEFPALESGRCVTVGIPFHLTPGT